MNARIVIGLSLIWLSAMLTAACASSPNEHVQSNEFFRPPPATEQTAQMSDEATNESEPSTQSTQSSIADAETDATASDDPQSQGQAQSDRENQSDQADQAGQAEQATSSDSDDNTPLQTSDDVIRRYTNPSYGYSFELICSPFCDPNSNGIDRVSFLSETGRALIGVDVVSDGDTSSEALLRSTINLADNIELSEQDDVTTVTGEPADRFDWEEDRRATGGFQVRWSALLVRVQDVAIVLRAGAVLDDYDAAAPALERALTSFILPLEIGARPGRYQRFEFALDYDPVDTAQEFGQPTSNPPAAESGILVLQTTNALKAVLTWQVLGQAFYDGDTAIQQSLRDALGIENVAELRDWSDIDGQPARTGETETQFGEGVMMIQSFAWYCPDSGREFTLHVLDSDDPVSVALPLIESFRCSSDSSEAE